jgi:hypothetical protein
LTSTFQTMLQDMKRDYDVQVNELDKFNQKVTANYNKVVKAQQEALRAVENEKNEVLMER